MTRVTIQNLLPGITYGIQLRSVSEGATSEWSRTFNITPTGDTTPPAVPTGLTVSVQGTSFVVRWNANTEADFSHYVLAATNGATTKTYIVTDNVFEMSLDGNREAFGTPKAAVSFKVLAEDLSKNQSAYTTTVNGTNPAPANPTGFTADAIVDGISLKWTAVADTDLVGYKVYYGTTAGSQTTVVWAGNSTNATIANFNYSTDAYYRVVAVDVFGSESASGPVTAAVRPKSSFAVDTTAPAVPTGLAATLTNATDGKTATAAVTWTAVTDTDGDLAEYIVGYKPSSETNWQYAKVDYTNTATTITGLLPYTNYDFRIRSSDWAANLSAWSATVTKTATANAAPATVTGVSVTGGKDSLTIKWTPNTEPDVANGAGVYLVDIATNTGFTTGLLSYRTGEASIVVTGLAQGTTYYARVKAVDSLGLASTSWSATASATTGTLASQFTYTTSATAPTSPNTGDVWMDSTSGFEKQWNGSAWVLTGGASTAYIQAKGTDLVVNGTGALGTNYNFSNFDFDAADAPVGATGAFKTKTPGSKTLTLDELIPVDPNKRLRMSFQVKEKGATTDARFYGFVAPYDSYKLSIQPGHYMYWPGTTTTLAAPLNPGDTTITLTDASTWYGTASKPAGTGTHNRSIIWWDYTDPGGKTWPIETYSRNWSGSDYWSDGGITGNVITLKAAYNGPARPAGTALSNGSSGGTYMYMRGAANVAATTTWTPYADSIVGYHTTPSSSAGFNTGWPQGTGYAKVGFLLNRTYASPYNDPNSQMSVALVSLSDASAANYAADTAQATANGKNKSTYSQSAPGSTSGAAGDLWFQMGDGASVSSSQVVAQYVCNGGTSWSQKTINNAVIANLDAAKINTGYLDVANRINAKAIDVSKLQITNSDNLITDPTFVGGTNTWQTNASITIDATGSRNGTGALKIVNAASQQASYNLPYEGIPVEGGSYFRGTAWVKATVDIPVGTVFVGLRFKSSTGTLSYPIAGKNLALIPANTWTKLDSLIVQAPADAVSMSIYLSSEAGLSTGTLWIDSPAVTRANDGQLIVDGSVTANKVVAGLIQAGSAIIADGAITTAKIGDAQITNAKINDLSVSKLTTGTISAITATIGAGGSFIVDATGVIKSNNYSANSTGYQLSNTGLEVNDGSIDAKALRTNTAIIGDLTIGRSADAAGSIKSYDYVAGSAGWKIGKGLFEINNGLIKAGAVQIQTSNNMMPPEYADFEYGDYYYLNAFWNARGQGNISISGGLAAGNTAADSLTVPFKGKQYLGVSSVGTNNAMAVTFAPTGTTYNIPVEPGQSYIFSGYFRNRLTTAQPDWLFGVKGEDGNIITTVPINLAAGPLSGTFTRYEGTVTIPAGINNVALVLNNADTTYAKDIHMDCFQFEPKGNLTAASPWKPPATTTIGASGITTGMMRSTADISVAGVNQPAWSLNKSGNIQVGDALIRGKLIVGTGTESLPNRAPGSGNFESDVNGYTAYQVGATNATIVRTTTAGEVITGSGSAKVTADAGTKTQLGVQFNTAMTYPTGTVISIAGNVKVDGAGGELRISYMDGATTVATNTVVPSLAADTVYNFTDEFVPTGGDQVTSVNIYQYTASTVTTTSFIIDDIVLTANNEIGESFVASSNFQAGEGGSGWRIDGAGNVEFNSGYFRGQLGSRIVTADSLASDIVMSSTFRTGADGQRVEFDQSGINMYDVNNLPVIQLPTDSSQKATFAGDLVASSMTIENNLAIRGDNNEISKGSTVMLQSGTTSPSSPPTVTVDWKTIAASADAEFAPYRYGITVQGGWFRVAQVVYNGGTVVDSYDLTTGARQWGNMNTAANDGMWNALGGITSIGNNVYMLGTNKAGNWRLMGWTFGTSVSGTPTKLFDVSYPQSTGHRIPAIGNDGTNILVALTNQTDLVQVRSFSATTGEQLTSALVSDLKVASDVAFVNKGAFDNGWGLTSGTPVYVVGLKSTATAYVMDQDFKRLAGGGYDFPLITKPSGQTFYNGKFYTFDAAGNRITEHTGATWNSSTAGMDKWWAANSWYNSTGPYETMIGPVAGFTMKKRARAVITAPPIPKPLGVPEDVKAVGLYMARGNTTPTRTYFQHQTYLADGVRTIKMQEDLNSVMPAPGVVNSDTASQPKSASNFPNTTPGALKDAAGRFALYGDGSGNWAGITVNTAGQLDISAKTITTTNDVTIGGSVYSANDVIVGSSTSTAEPAFQLIRRNSDDTATYTSFAYIQGGVSPGWAMQYRKDGVMSSNIVLNETTFNSSVPFTAPKFKLGGAPAARGVNWAEIYKNATWTASNGAWTTVSFSTYATDGGNIVKTDDGTVYTSSALWSRVAGFFNINVSITFAANSTGYRAIRIIDSDGNVIQRTGFVAADTPFRDIHTAASFYLAAGKSVQVQVYQNSGANMTMPAHVADAPCYVRFVQVA